MTLNCTWSISKNNINNKLDWALRALRVGFTTLKNGTEARASCFHGGPALGWKIYFIWSLPPFFARECSKNPKSARGPLNVNPVLFTRKCFIKIHLAVMTLRSSLVKLAQFNSVLLNDEIIQAISVTCNRNLSLPLQKRSNDRRAQLNHRNKNLSLIMLEKNFEISD